MKRIDAEVVSVDAGAGSGVLRASDGSALPFRLSLATGVVPVAGLAVVAQLGDDGTVDRVHLPAHPSKADPLPSPDVFWVTVLREAPLPDDRAQLRALLEGAGTPAPRIAIHPTAPDGTRSLGLFWPRMQMLLAERPTPFPLERADRRALPQGFTAGNLGVRLLPAPVDLAEERRQAGGALPDPWGPEGTLRRASRLIRALLVAGGRGVVLHRAGDLAFARDDMLRRLGDLEDPAVRPFGAWIDWALTPDRSAYRTLGMAALGGEDVEIVLENPDAEVEVDSAESALLFACMLQVRENRLLGDGEMFHVPKDVRVGAKGAAASSRTGYRYLAHRGHARVQLVRG